MESKHSLAPGKRAPARGQLSAEQLARRRSPALRTEGEDKAPEEGKPKDEKGAEPPVLPSNDGGRRRGKKSRRRTTRKRRTTRRR